jgi:uncharacterized membrane protein YedE/YeeE
MVSFVSGLVFSIGLVISGMINPDKVIGFLDIFGDWDYSLAFVMGGAVIFNVISFRVLIKRDKTFFNGKLELPTSNLIDKRLLIGSSLFGVGWGLIGICPGPGIVNLSTLNPKILVFVLSMIIGMYIFKILQERKIL